MPFGKVDLATGWLRSDVSRAAGPFNNIVEKGIFHAWHNPHCISHSNFAWRDAHLGAQPFLGLRTKWRRRINIDDPDRVGFDRPALNA